MDVVLSLSMQGFQDWAVVWLPIIFMGLIVVLLVATLRLMPMRTKPQQIKPKSADAVRWKDVAGADEANAAFERFAAAGMHVVRSTNPIAEWPGLGARPGALAKPT